MIVQENYGMNAGWIGVWMDSDPLVHAALPLTRTMLSGRRVGRSVGKKAHDHGQTNQDVSEPAISREG